MMTQHLEVGKTYEITMPNSAGPNHNGTAIVLDLNDLRVKLRIENPQMKLTSWYPIENVAQLGLREAIVGTATTTGCAL